LGGLENSRDVAAGDRCGLVVQFIAIFLATFLDSRKISAPIDCLRLADRRGLLSQSVAISLRRRRNRPAPID